MLQTLSQTGSRQKCSAVLSNAAHLLVTSDLHIQVPLLYDQLLLLLFNALRQRGKVLQVSSCLGNVVFTLLELSLQGLGLLVQACQIFAFALQLASLHSHWHWCKTAHEGIQILV